MAKKGQNIGAWRESCSARSTIRSNRPAARLSAVSFASFVAVVLLTSLEVRADVYWKVASPNSGDWSVATNWTGGLPTSSVTAWIINGGTANVTQLGETCGTLSLGGSGSGTVKMTGGSLSTASYQYVGYSGTGTFMQSGGINGSGYFNLYLGYNAGSSGTYNLSGSGQLSPSFYQYVGYSGPGTFTQSGGSHGAPSGSYADYPVVYLGYNLGSSGTYNLSGGQFSPYGETVGYSGSGTFTQSGGTNTDGTNSVYGLNLYLGYDLAAAARTASAARPVVCGSDRGYSGTGTLRSPAEPTAIGNLYLGYNARQQRHVQPQRQRPVVGRARNEYIGYSGTGTFNQSGGTNNCVSQSLYSAQTWRQRNLQPKRQRVVVGRFLEFCR